MRPCLVKWPKFAGLVGLRKLSLLFHEDAQDDQDDQLINLPSSRGADEIDGHS
jgi:hypothetical protein